MRYTLEPPTRFSQSILWRLQKSFYDDTGVDAFVSNNAIPSFITSNAFIARRYARLILGFVHDEVAAGRLDSSHPVYVVEAGSGAGRFAYLLLKGLVEGVHLAGVPLSCIK